MQQPRGATVRSPSAIDKAEDPASEFLTFRLGEERYGIETLKVQEIRGHASPTAIATLPADSIQPTPEFSSATFDTRYITGLGSIDGLKLILLEIEKLMTGADMAPVETAAH